MHTFAAYQWCFRLFFAAMVLAAMCPSAAAMDRVTFKNGEQTQTVEGRVEVEAADGGLLLLSRGGALWNIEPNQIVERKSDDAPFQPYGADELAKAMLAELPPGFEVHTTAHYVIVHNTSKAYAQWCGALFERLQAAFLNFWSRRGLDLHEPRVPLAAIVFADKKSYVQYARNELGDNAGAIIGYYSLKTNRMAMYDLTGTGVQEGGQRLSSAQINAMLSKPQAERTVATVIHEATHQIAYNSGLQTRYADIPLWLNEGIAMYFETPDLASEKGWRGLGNVNRYQLANFRNYLPRRKGDSLQTLLASDERFRDPRNNADAYGEAWSLTHFLARQKSKQLAEYLKRMSKKPQLVWNKPDQRLAEFVEVFGELESLEKEFLRDIGRLK